MPNDDQWEDVVPATKDFQYIKLPDGSYGKFRADATDEQIRAAVTKDFPNAYGKAAQWEDLVSAPQAQQTAQASSSQPVNKLYAKHPANLQYKNLRESPEKIAQRQAASETVDKWLGRGAGAATLAATGYGIAAAPLTTLGSIVGAEAGSDIGGYGARKLGADKDVQRIAEIGGGTLGGIAGGFGASRLEIPETINLGQTGIKLRVPSWLRTAPPSGRVTVPSVSSAASPTSGVSVFPEPRPPVGGEDPNYMASVPRDELAGLAAAGKPGAAEHLRNLGRTVIYVPRATLGKR
jgi:hypothetical protein